VFSGLIEKLVAVFCDPSRGHGDGDGLGFALEDERERLPVMLLLGGDFDWGHIDIVHGTSPEK